MRPPSAAQSRAVAVAPAPRGFPGVACPENIARDIGCLLLTHTSIRAAGPVSGAPHPQPAHELVERALATAITRQPDAPQDFDAWKVRILAQPLRDPRRVWRRDRRAPRAVRLRSRRHLARARTIHGRTPPQIRCRNRIP